MGTEVSDQQFLSTDPQAGLPNTPASSSSSQTMTATHDTDPVTLGDLMADPSGSMKRIGLSVKRDVSDPKLWLALAASYFGPKAFSAAAPIVARAAAATGRVAGELATPGMGRDLATVGLGDARVNAGIRIAGRLSDAVGAAKGAQPASPEPISAGVTPEVGKAMRDLSQAGTPIRFTAPETAQGLKWMRDGVSQSEIVKRIMDARALNQATGLAK